MIDATSTSKRTVTHANDKRPERKAPAFESFCIPASSYFFARRVSLETGVQSLFGFSFVRATTGVA